LFQRIAHTSLGLVVHTDFARRCLLTESPNARVAYIPLAVESPRSLSERQPAGWPQFPPETVVLASFGVISPSKRIETILQALARLHSQVSNWRYLLVGEPVPGYDLIPLIQDLGLVEMVIVAGRLHETDFETWMSAVDLGFNLRTGPTGGEMSATLGQLMACGRPVLVSDVGGFSDLPDDCVIKIRQDETEVEQIVAALRRLIADPSARAAYGEAARLHVQREWSFPRVARDYASFVQSCIDAVAGSAQRRA
jgi:glycosyltransferase involved in cell wall biosynthesis